VIKCSDVKRDDKLHAPGRCERSSALVTDLPKTPLSYQRRRAIVNLQSTRQTTTNMKTPLRIAILECDTPPPDVVEKFGRYDRVFATLLESAAEGLGLSPKQDLELSAYDVVTAQEYPDLESIDAVLISGSSMYYTFSHHLGGLID
jgi:hypothetical protein